MDTVITLWNSFLQLPRWVQIAIPGALVLLVLLLMVLLFRRSARRPLDDAALERFYHRPSKKGALRIMEELPDQGLFTVFRAALHHKGVAGELLAFAERSEDLFIYRRIALSGKGEPFDGAGALELLRDHLDRIREMTGDPEWAARYMAVRILLEDEDERSRRSVRELFHDPHPLIRRTIIDGYRSTPGDVEDDDEFYRILFSYLTDDTAFEVRSQARKRIGKDYGGRFEVDFSALRPSQALHVVEQFDTASEADRSYALGLLDGEDLEIRFAAAQFLEKAGVLESLFLEVSFDDRDLMERNRRLLQKAVEVDTVSFLSMISGTDNFAALTIAAELLHESGEASWIRPLTEKVLSRGEEELQRPEMERLFTSVLECIKLRGDEGSIAFAAEELQRRCRRNDPRGALILEHLPASPSAVVLPVLMDLLKSGGCPFREELHGAFLRFDPSLYLSDLMAILKAGREEYPHDVRISTLILLGKLKLSWAMQFLLEQMPVLPFEEARDFSRHLKEYAGKLFQERVLENLEQDDGKVRASLIVAVPATGIKEFLKPIRDAVQDADPEVRRAAVWALLEYGDQKSIKSSLDLLRDPVERVRMEAARALGSGGNGTILESFEELLQDANEVDPVKSAALQGLGASGETKSVDLLVNWLKDHPEELFDEAVNALAEKRDPKLIKRMVEKLKDAEPELRDRIVEAFRRMGEAAEKPLLDLLDEGIGSLVPHITGVLESTGFVEHAIRKLNHRDPEVRREAAKKLSGIATTAAFRGIVLASRDPDQEVRVMVTRALEKLSSESGKEILEELKNDPDKKIRKYTLWALERVEAKGTEDKG